MIFLIGLVGMICILIAFILDEFSTGFNQDNKWYNGLNILGSGLLAYYAFALDAWPFLILNGVWCITAVLKLLKISISRKILTHKRR